RRFSPTSDAPMTIEKLADADLEQGLQRLSEWSRSGESIQRTFAFADFVAAMAFVDRVAERAEEVQHHPDILVRWNKVTLTLSTHDAGGLTEKDLALAAECDGFAID
ncbi:MAG: 4a-hydroxytetrahydrobiopterin dehydratase, partial [Phycisphaerales bacterium]